MSHFKTENAPNSRGGEGWKWEKREREKRRGERKRKERKKEEGGKRKGERVDPLRI